MKTERKDYNISIETELKAIEELSQKLINDGYHAENTVVVTVSTDYSSIAGQLIRHNLSKNGEIVYGFGCDVPYPTQIWDNLFILNLHDTFKIHEKEFEGKTLLLVENAIIRGGNYKFLTEWISKHYPNIKVVTLSLFENIHSKFQSDYVWHYYNNELDDITFSWEKENNNWK